jgi:DNA-binding transcriptional MerR regulator
MAMPHTVKEVARLSGVSVRTLHHYDEIGLLKPAYYGDNGYRYYEEEQLLRLQQIMLFRELDMPLERIREVLDSGRFDRLAALQEHKRLLQQKAERLRRLLTTIDQTIDHLKGERRMRDEQFFDGFDRQRAEQVKRELREHFGDGIRDEPFEQSLERTKGWSKADYDDVKQAYDEIHRAMAALIEQGAAADSADAQALVRKHHGVVNRFYGPTKEIYKGLGRMYTDHPEFRKLYDSYHPQLAEFMREAMAVFADREL